MFDPKFTYTDKLVSNIGTIRELVGGLNARKFPNTVLLEFEKEAKALSAHSSTSIEGNPLPLTAVKKILKAKPEYVRDSEREVLNYNNALVYLDNQIGESEALTTGRFGLSNELICSIQAMVIEGLLPEYGSGKYRRQPVFVNDHMSGQTVYWPPDHQDLSQLMNDLVDYVNSNQQKVEHLVLAGIFHRQFVIIHPFIDGNGRTVRLVTKLLLAQMGLDTFRLFSFENYYNSNVTKYFLKVGVRGNYYDEFPKWDFTEWLEYFTDGIIDEITRVASLLPKSTTINNRIEIHHRQILDLLDEKGSLQDSDYAKTTRRSRGARLLDFQKLLDLGLIERKGKGRGTYYVLR